MIHKRLLHLIDTGGPGGAETIFLMLVRGLANREWDSTPVVPREGWLSEALRGAGFDPIVLENRRSFDLSYVFRLVSLGRELGIDLIQAHLLGSAAYGTLAAMVLRVPLVCTFHGTPDIPSRGRSSRAKTAILSRKRNRTVFVSERLRDQLAPPMGISPSRCSVIPNGVDTSGFSARRSSQLKTELGIPHEHTLLGAVGNLRPAKAYDILLKAFSEIASVNPEVQMVIAGQTKEPLFSELVELRSSLGLDSAVHFLGFRGDTPTLFEGLDLFVLSSASEGFSLSTVQAMASGLPVVATRCGGPEGIVVDGDTGRLVEANDPRALAKGIQEVLTRPDGGKEMGMRGRERAETEFSLDAMLGRYEALYREMLPDER